MSDWEPTRWWRVRYWSNEDGWHIWCETSDEEEVRADYLSAVEQFGSVNVEPVQRLMQRVERKWESA